MDHAQNDNPEKLLGNNLKHLREMHGETLQELGKVVHLGNTTIKNYENADRKPDPQTLKALAKHYGKTVDELLQSDLSESGSISISVSNPAELVKILEVILPLSYTDKALSNPDFKKGYDGCCRIMNSFAINVGIRGSIISECFEAFGKSVEDAELPEGIANMVWLIFLLWSQLLDENMIRALNTLMYPRKNSPPFIKTFLEAKEHESSEIKNKKKSFIEDFDEIIIELMRALKSEFKWSNLADYYLALRYVLSIVDTGLSAEMNSAVGMQMMLSFLRLGNPYALNYVEMSLKK